MRSRVVLVVLALCISAPSRGATLAERAAQIDAPTRGGVITLSGPIQVGRAEIVPAKGTLVRSLMAGGVPCGLVVEGPAQLLYRVDDRFTASLAGTFRALGVGTFAPLARLRWERNKSTLEIYDFRRITLELGITSAF